MWARAAKQASVSKSTLHDGCRIVDADDRSAVITFTGGGRSHGEEQGPQSLSPSRSSSRWPRFSSPTRATKLRPPQIGAVPAQGSPAAVTALPLFFTHLPTPAPLSISCLEPPKAWNDGECGAGADTCLLPGPPDRKSVV